MRDEKLSDLPEQPRIGAVTGHFGAIRAVGWAMEDSAERMMRSSFAALADGDAVSAQRRQIIASREYHWAACLYEVLGMVEDYARARLALVSVQAGEWVDPKAGAGMTTPSFRTGMAVAMARHAEDQRSIGNWADETFGEPISNASIAVRALKEMSELVTKLVSDDDHPGAGEETADVVIVLYRLATYLGVDLHDEVNKKMAINRRRKWVLDGNGHGQHVADQEGK